MVLRKFFTELPDGEHEIEAKTRHQRSASQNKYYWGVVIPMVFESLNHLGWQIKDKEEVHHYLTSMFLIKRIVNHDTGETIEMPGKSSECTTIEFNDYIARIQKWAAEYLHINIPDPNTQSKLWQQ